MSRTRSVLQLAAAVLFVASCHDAQLKPDAPTVTCRAPLAPAAFRLVDRFDGVRFFGPLALARAGRDWLVAGQDGKVVRVVESEGTHTAVPFLDLGAVLAETTGESGLIGFAASPDYVTKPEVFAVYTGRSDVPGSVFRLVYSRFTSRDGGATIDPATEEILFTIEREEKGHNGGRLVFGPDRLLYVGIGDGSWGDPLRRAQDPAQLFGKIVRLDVLGAARPEPEVFAIGLRNPWSFSFAPDGRLWVGDVGHEHYEEINIVTKGGNYGWPIHEGRHCFVTAPAPCEVPGGAIDPVHEYAHADGFSVTGGYVYRGSQPELAGLYVFGDFMTGRLAALDAANPSDDARLLLDSGRFISAFGEDDDGEILVVDFAGQVLRLEANAAGQEEAATLGSLGCLDDPSLIPYDVNAELWSDGLDKRRWLGLPGFPIHVTDEETFHFPIGTVLLKELSAHGQKIETRMLTKSVDESWLAYTFEWNEGQTDAVLLREGKSVDVDGVPWTVPSRSQCSACHRRGAGTVLGFTPPQLARGDRLDVLAQRGLLDRPVDGARVTPLVDPFDPLAAPLESRARSYLAANCSQCHSGMGTAVDLRFTTALADTLTVCRTASASYDLASDTKPFVIHPGDAASSVLYQRMSHAESGLMPPLGRARVDTAAVDLISSWIDGMKPCP
ncbi:MAG: PQQ-dependent sugar dehydrogenase [Labilithrix sp.]|nr:PQQ-dependent sugar dehydrogenase [Labilithrix sp.]MCW5818238.1 PQQ-dependent sugar dehydrogenase [Labilithrix sp.]